ncbi:MAG: hypothetical protein JST40_06665 [Armatimonadetes bacterium]|nr:hypothetical protein [Armatimonadota bacterium]
MNKSGQLELNARWTLVNGATLENATTVVRKVTAPPFGDASKDGLTYGRDFLVWNQNSSVATVLNVVWRDGGTFHTRLECALIDAAVSEDQQHILVWGKRDNKDIGFDLKLNKGKKQFSVVEKSLLNRTWITGDSLLFASNIAAGKPFPPCIGATNDEQKLLSRLSRENMRLESIDSSVGAIAFDPRRRFILQRRFEVTGPRETDLETHTVIISPKGIVARWVHRFSVEIRARSDGLLDVFSARPFKFYTKSTGGWKRAGIYRFDPVHLRIKAVHTSKVAQKRIQEMPAFEGSL